MQWDLQANQILNVQPPSSLWVSNFCLPSSPRSIHSGKFAHGWDHCMSKHWMRSFPASNLEAHSLGVSSDFTRFAPETKETQKPMLKRSFADSKKFNQPYGHTTSYNRSFMNFVVRILDPWHWDPSGSPKTFTVFHCICPNYYWNKHRLVFLLSLSGWSSSPKNTSRFNTKPDRKGRSSSDL